MKMFTLGVVIGVLAAFEPLSPLQAQEMSEEGCTQRIVDYQRDCGAVVGQQSLFRLEKPGDCAKIEIDAESRWNASGILFEKGVAYHIRVIGGKDAVWYDEDIEATAEGWCTRPGSKCKRPGELKGWIIGLMEPLRLFSDHDWFYLMGAVAAEEYEQFPIGIEIKDPKKPNIEGEFCSFANDVSFKYGNNSRSLRLKITRESK